MDTYNNCENLLLNHRFIFQDQPKPTPEVVKEKADKGAEKGAETVKEAKGTAKEQTEEIKDKGGKEKQKAFDLNDELMKFQQEQVKKTDELLEPYLKKGAFRKMMKEATREATKSTKKELAKRIKQPTTHQEDINRLAQAIHEGDKNKIRLALKNYDEKWGRKPERKLAKAEKREAAALRVKAREAGREKQKEALASITRKSNQYFQKADSLLTGYVESEKGVFTIDSIYGKKGAGAEMSNRLRKANKKLLDDPVMRLAEMQNIYRTIKDLVELYERNPEAESIALQKRRLRNEINKLGV